MPFRPGGGRNFGDWYQPLHENGNALSYPQLGPDGLVPLAPGDLGLPATLKGSDQNGTQPAKQLPQPLLNKGYLVDSTGSSVSLTISGTSGSGSTTNTNNTISESADVDGGMKSKFNIGVVKGSACAGVDLKFNNSNSWGTLKTATTSTTSTNTFTLQQDGAAQPNWAYGAATAYYSDPSGVYRASHAVDLLASTESAPEWKQYYARRADPALNLPNRMVMTYSQVDKANDIPNFNDSDSRQLIRGAFVLHPDADHGGAAGTLTAGAPFAAPADGDTVQLQVRVHNFSLDTAATSVPVTFYAVARNADDTQNAGSPIMLGTTTVPSIAPRGWQPANLLWDTTGRAPTGYQLYRVFAVVAANDPVMGTGDPWNNVIHAWQDRYNQPATVDGTPNTDRLTDPLTGQYETLEAGQNKQGYFEVTLAPKPASTVAAAGTGGAVLGPPTITALRFGSGGVRVSLPTARTALAGAAGTGGAGITTDRVQEVRLHVAAAGTALGNSICHDDNNSATLQLYEGDPAQGGTMIASRRLHGLAGGGPAGRVVTVPWTPRTAGRRQLVARLYGASMDPAAAPVQTTVDVDVAPVSEPPATLGRLHGCWGCCGSPPTCGWRCSRSSRWPTPPRWPVTSPAPGRPSRRSRGRRTPPGGAPLRPRRVAGGRPGRPPAGPARHRRPLPPSPGDPGRHPQPVARRCGRDAVAGYGDARPRPDRHPHGDSHSHPDGHTHPAAHRHSAGCGHPARGRAPALPLGHARRGRHPDGDRDRHRHRHPDGDGHPGHAHADDDWHPGHSYHYGDGHLGHTHPDP